jgi:hypothetical protein
LNLKPSEENSKNCLKLLPFIPRKISIISQGPYRATMAIEATEPEPLQKSEFFLKNAIFTALKTSKHGNLYFLVAADICNKT